MTLKVPVSVARARKVVLAICRECDRDRGYYEGDQLPRGWAKLGGNELCPSCAKEHRVKPARAARGRV